MSFAITNSLSFICISNHRKNWNYSMMSFSAETTEELSGLLQDLLAASQSRPEMLTHFQVRIRVEYLSVQARDGIPTSEKIRIEIS